MDAKERAFDKNRLFGKDTVQYYYDYHLTREDLLTGYAYPDLAVYVLLDTLNWLLKDAPCFIAHKLNLYRTDDPTEVPLCPEVAVFKGVSLTEEEKLDLRSWPLVLGLPAPDVVFEFTAHEKWQWKQTFTEKPRLYQAMGVKELFVYDGLHRWSSQSKSSLRGWRFEGAKMLKLKPDKRYWLWSQELGSWLEGNPNYVFLYDEEGAERPTEFQVLEAQRGNHYLKNGLLLNERVAEEVEDE